MSTPFSAQASALRIPQPDGARLTTAPGTVSSQLRRHAHTLGLLLVLLGCATLLANCLVGLKGQRDWNFSDFKCVYSGARCMILGCNPYDEDVLIKTYAAAGGDPAHWFPVRQYNANYLPPALFLTVPLAALPWGPAKAIWILFSCAAFMSAAVLTWDLARPYAPIFSGALIGAFVGSSSVLLRTANPAAIAIGLSAIAIWCCLKEKFVAVGIACLAISLAFKPHDSWLIWVWLFLGAGLRRRRAFQVVGVFLAFSLPAILWFSLAPNSSHWVHDLHANLAGNVSRGFADDPGPANAWAFTLTNLQAVVSVLVDDPHVYNPAAYLISGLLFLAWLYPTLKGVSSRTKDLFSVACISAISLLPLYHRQYDTRLLLLLFPATAVVWAGGGPLAWVALLLAGASILFAPSRVLLTLSDVRVASVGSWGKIETIVLHRPVPLVVLALSIFYLILLVNYAKRRLPHTV